MEKRGSPCQERPQTPPCSLRTPRGSPCGECPQTPPRCLSGHPEGALAESGPRHLPTLSGVSQDMQHSHPSRGTQVPIRDGIRQMQDRGEEGTKRQGTNCLTGLSSDTSQSRYSATRIIWWIILSTSWGKEGKSQS